MAELPEALSIEPLSIDSRPRLARKARLRTDRVTGETLLLYPEHGLILNASAAAIMRLCDGRAVSDIASALDAPVGDVLELLTTLHDRGLVTA
jgi:pyrroloquinoline quinone biosynthesis protein D